MIHRDTTTSYQTTTETCIKQNQEMRVTMQKEKL